MAKASEVKWVQAKAMYEAGTSLRDIEAETGIPYKTIDNRAKVKGWVKGALAQHIADSIKVAEEFGTMDLAQQTIVAQTVSKAVERMEWLNTAALKNVSEAMKAACSNQHEFKARADTILKGKEAVFGKVPDTIINNTNAQQTQSIIYEVIR